MIQSAAFIVALLSTIQEPPKSLFEPPLLSASDAVRDWSGFEYAGANRRWPSAFSVGPDWSKLPEAPASKASAPAYKVRITLFERALCAHSSALGFGSQPESFTPVSGTMEKIQSNRIRMACVRLPNLIARMSSGHLDGKVSLRAVAEPSEVTPEFLAAFLRASTNDGMFEAEDTVDRGPFQSQFVVLPFAIPNSWKPALLQLEHGINGSEVSVVGIDELGLGTPGSFAEALLAARIHEHLGRRLKRQFVEGQRTSGTAFDEPSGLPHVSRWVADTELSLLTEAGSGDASTLLVAARESRTKIQPSEVKGVLLGAIFGGMEAAVVDNDLEVMDRGIFREGKMALPVPANGFGEIAKLGKSLSLSFSSAPNEPVAIRFVLSNGKVAESVLGRDVPVVAGQPFEIHLGLTEVQKLGADLARIEIGTPNSLVGTQRRSVGGIKFRLRKIGFTQNDPTPIATSAAAPTLYDQIRAGGETMTVEKLAEFTNDLNALAALAAVEKLEKLGSEEAKQALARASRFAFSDLVKAAAGMALGRSKEERFFNDLTFLGTRDSFAARYASLKAIGLLAEKNAKWARYRLAALAQEDPAIQAMVLADADPNDDVARRRLLYGAINDPWDSLRLICAQSLIRTMDTAARTEALRVAQDDSPNVRARYVEFLGKAQASADVSLKAEIRTILRQAVVDRDAKVRSEALKALLATGTAELAEYQNLLSDPHPLVQISLLEQHLQGKLKLDESIWTALQSSPFAEVSRVARSRNK